MADLTPTPKITAATVAGAVTVLAVWLAGRLGVDVPELVAAAMAVLLTAGAGYLRREGP